MAEQQQLEAANNTSATRTNDDTAATGAADDAAEKTRLAAVWASAPSKVGTPLTVGHAHAFRCTSLRASHTPLQAHFPTTSDCTTHLFSSLRAPRLPHTPLLLRTGTNNGLRVALPTPTLSADTDGW